MTICQGSEARSEADGSATNDPPHTTRPLSDRGPKRHSQNTDVTNGNALLRHSCPDVKFGQCGVKMGLCDLRLGHCGVSLDTGDIILGTGEILRNSCAFNQNNGRLRTLSCQTLNSPSAMKASRCTKIPKSGSHHSMNDNHKNSKSSKHKSQEDVEWKRYKRNNLRNRPDKGSVQSCNDLRNSNILDQSALLMNAAEQSKSMEALNSQPTEGSSSSERVDEFHGCDKTNSHISIGASEDVSNSSDSEDVRTLHDSRQTVNSIDMRPPCATKVLAEVDNMEKDPEFSSVRTCKMRRSHSDFLKGNRKMRRASICVQDGSVKVIMHGEKVIDDSPHLDSDDSCVLANSEEEGENKPKGDSVETVDEEEEDREGGQKEPEIPVWKLRPHPLIPNGFSSRPWWEDCGEDEVEEVGISRSSSVSSVDSLAPPRHVTTSEMSLLLRTLRHHYIFKVYMPMYRLLHLQSRRNDREEIRRKLAMGLEEEYYGGERMYKKPNLQTRLQSGMNLQICFMNEATSDVDSVNGDGEDVSSQKSSNKDPALEVGERIFKS